jgi:hypothetical protein
MKHLKLFENFNDEIFENKDLIIVDIQPEYEEFFNFNIYDYIEFLNINYKKFNKIILLYNGYETLGMITENDFRFWLLENGLEEDVLNYIETYDKSYAFFRFCLDSNIEDDMIITLVKWMYEKNINDSRDITLEDWDEIEKYYGKNISLKEIRLLLENADDMINIPDLMNYLKNNVHNKILLTGGGLKECLKEVEIALQALDKPYKIYDKFTY